jgi:uroporphyrin-III C-methyltransferase
MNSKGKVILAGAGPGDPELITLKALNYIKTADVIITDRLVSKALFQYSKKDSLIIQLGKQRGNEASTSQEEINQNIIHYAREGKLVLRLKGGDVAIYSHVLEELKALVENEIPFEIIPGVTAASGASAYSGIPLTARGYASAVRFLAGYNSEEWRLETWKELAATEDTLVFYMSAENTAHVVQKLVQQGMDKEKKLAIVEQATTPRQRVRIYDLNEFVSGIQPVSTPALIIIGSVVSLHKEFKWVKDSVNEDSYFPPAGESKSLPDNAS